MRDRHETEIQVHIANLIRFKLEKSGNSLSTSYEYELPTDSHTAYKVDCHWLVVRMSPFFDMLGEQLHYSNPANHGNWNRVVSKIEI